MGKGDRPRLRAPSQAPLCEPQPKTHQHARGWRWEAAAPLQSSGPLRRVEAKRAWDAVRAGPVSSRSPALGSRPRSEAVVLLGDLADTDAVESCLPPVVHPERKHGTRAEPARENEPPRPVRPRLRRGRGRSREPSRCPSHRSRPRTPPGTGGPLVACDDGTDHRLRPWSRPAVQRCAPSGPNFLTSWKPSAPTTTLPSTSRLAPEIREKISASGPSALPTTHLGSADREASVGAAAFSPSPVNSLGSPHDHRTNSRAIAAGPAIAAATALLDLGAESVTYCGPLHWLPRRVPGVGSVTSRLLRRSVRPLASASRSRIAASLAPLPLTSACMGRNGSSLCENAVVLPVPNLHRVHCFPRLGDSLPQALDSAARWGSAWWPAGAPTCTN